MKHFDLNKTLLEILNKRTTRSFNVGKCKLTLHSLDGKILGLQGVRLEARDRGKGEATRALLSLFDAVDTLGVRVRLQVQPMDKKTNKTGLVRLYSRFGFKKFNDKASVGYFMMERKPQHKHTANEAHASKKENTGMSLKAIAEQLATAGVKTKMVIAVNSRSPRDKKILDQDTLTKLFEGVGHDEFQPNQVFVEVCALSSDKLEMTTFVKGKYNFYIDFVMTFGKSTHISVSSRGSDEHSKNITGSYTDNVGFDNVDTLLAGNGREFRSFLREMFTKIKHRYITKAAHSSTVIADSGEKFQVPPSVSKSWKRDTSIEDYEHWEWKPVRNHRVTVSGKPGKLKISTFNIPAPGSWVLDVDGKFSKLGTERRFATLKEAVKSFVIAYNHYKPE